MALSRKKATTIALDPEADQLLTRAARERGVSRSEFIRQQLALVLEQYRRHPKPRSAGSFARCPNGATSASCSVAGGSAAALICDTGALLDYLVKDAPDHQRFRHAIDRARTRYVPGLVLAEVDYFLRDERPAMKAFMDDLARGALRTPHRQSISSLERWISTGDMTILAWASSTRLSWCSLKISAFVALRRETFGTSPPCGCATEARSSLSFIPTIPIGRPFWPFP